MQELFEPLRVTIVCSYHQSVSMRNFVRSAKTILRQHRIFKYSSLRLSTIKTENPGLGYESTTLHDPVRQVFISQSSDIFANLALEDWLYRNHDFDNKHLLLLWRNDPCVVIGRHQNPWTEANVPYLRNSSVSLARRNSGGGTVFHDLGNVNCTFFTRKYRYHRRLNLDIICSAIQRITDLDVSVNKRDDIVLNQDYKISGTAAKIGKDNAYHHCTVLVDVNECLLHDALNSQAVGVDTRAAQSVRVPIKNLKAVDNSISVDRLQESIGWEFLRTNLEGIDGGMESARNQRGFQMIRPDNDWFPGLDKLRDDLRSHGWIFGKTPRFKVSRDFHLPENIFPTLKEEDFKTKSEPNISIELDIHLGIIQNVKVVFPMDKFGDSLDLTEVMHGLMFGPKLVQNVGNRLLERSELSTGQRNFLLDCVRQMIGKFA